MSARLRRPVRLLQCPDRASLQRPRGLRQVCSDPATGAGTGFGRLSGRCAFAPSGDWDSGNPAFAISRGSPGAPLPTPGHDRRFPGMLFSLHLSDRGSAIRSRDISPVPARFAGNTTLRLVAQLQHPPPSPITPPAPARGPHSPVLRSDRSATATRSARSGGSNAQPAPPHPTHPPPAPPSAASPPASLTMLGRPVGYRGMPGREPAPPMPNRSRIRLL